MSKWKEYLQKQADAQKDRSVKPWDMLNPMTEYADEILASERFDICKRCPKLVQSTKQCIECGCFMAAKTKLKHATCPLNKW